MVKPLIKIKLLTLIFTFLISVTFLTPVYANFFPFFFNKSTKPRDYSNLEDKIEIYNNQAIELFEEGHFKEAQELWEKAVRIMERSRNFVQEYGDLQGDLLSEEEMFNDLTSGDMSGTSEIEDLYRTAVSAFKKQKYSASKKMFERVEAKTPDYKATRNYLTILKYKIKQVQQSLNGDKFKESAFSREAERGEWRKILKESEKELEIKMIEQVAPLYKEAIGNYKVRKFKLAKEYFLEIDSILPKYKDTLKYLSRIDVDIRGEEQRTLTEKYKAQTLVRKKEQEEWHRIIEESEKKLEGKMKQQAEPVYQEALYYYKQREFDLAKNRFEEVERIFTDYKSTGKYLGRIDQDAANEIERQEQERLRKYEQEIRDKELARKRNERRLEKLREAEEKNRIEKFEREVAARRKDREEWLEVLRESEMERQRKLTQQADYIYQEAVLYYKRRDFKEAREDFLEVEQILPDYKSTVRFLTKVDRAIAQEEQQRLVQKERMIKKKIRENQWVEQQKDEEERHFRLVEGKKRMQAFKERALLRKKQRDEWDRALRVNERERQKRLDQEAEYIYKEALRSYRKQHWEEARSGFLETQEISLGYKKSDKYLARIDQDIRNAEMKRRAKADKEIESQRQREMMVREAEEERRMRLFQRDRRKQITQQQKQAESIYKYAVSLYRKGEYVLAKDKFREVEDFFPGYKSVRRYLGRIDQDLINMEGFSQYDQELAARQTIRKQRIAQKREEKKLRRLLQAEEKRWRMDINEAYLTRQRDREDWAVTVKQIEAENHKRLKRQAEMTYKEALRYYKAGWFEQAKEAFREVEATMPGYKSTKKYIARSKRNIQKERKLTQYTEARIQEFLDTEETLRMANQKRISYPIPEKNGSLVVKQAVEQRQKELSQQAEIKYRQALEFYKANNFIEAKLMFIEVESFSPGYKSTLNYLARINNRISGQELFTGRDYLIKQALSQEENGFISEPSKEVIVQQRQQGHSTDDRRKALRAQRHLIQQQYDKQFKQLYNKAIHLYKSGSFEEAQKLFVQIERMKPGYKRAASYLRKANAKIEKGYQKKKNNVVVRSQEPNTRDDVIGNALDIIEQRL